MTLKELAHVLLTDEVQIIDLRNNPSGGGSGLFRKDTVCEDPCYRTGHVGYVVPYDTDGKVGVAITLVPTPGRL